MQDVAVDLNQELVVIHQHLRKQQTVAYLRQIAQRAAQEVQALRHLQDAVFSVVVVYLKG
ncbi:hypothetical protein D3C75_1326620 [compost metagenome]